MFRRREDGTEELISDAETTTAPAAATATPATPVTPASAPTSAPQAPQGFRPTPPQAAMAAASRAPMTPSPASTTANEGTRSAATPVVNRQNSKRVLTVGPDIQMKGEITSCDRVVIEGTVDATMRDVHTVELAETGSLKGTAEVEDAEFSGTFEGDLTVRGKLTIHSTGRVRGNVTYGEIEIQRGGQISGNVRNVAEAKAAGAAAPMQGKAKAA